MQALKYVLPAFLLLLGSCRVDSGLGAAEGPTFVYNDPRVMLPFPSDRFLARDAGPRAEIDESATGYHINVAPFAKSDPALAIAPYVAESLASLDGFGTSAEIAIGLTFGADITAFTDPASAYLRSVADSSPLWLISIDPAAPDAGQPHPYVARFEPDGNTLFLRPWKPLRASSWYAVVVRNGLRDGLGRPFVPPPGFAANFQNPHNLELEGEGYTQLKQVYSGPVVFALTFRTASISVKLRELAAEVRRAAPSPITFTTRPTEAAQPLVDLIIEGWFTHREYRDAEGKLGRRVVREDKVPFTLALPKNGGDVHEPFPLVLAQHGFSSNRQSMLALANGYAKEGMATLAIDAPNHGSRGRGDGVNLDFLYGVRDVFGIWTDGDSIALKPWYFRDLLRQQVLAHLQLLLALKAWEGDVTRATNTPGIDLDLARAGYIGHSMGAVMGGVSGAITPEFKRVVLNVGGGRITDVFVGNEKIGAHAMTIIRPRGASYSDGWRMISMVQSAIDPGDPINYVAHIGKAPFPGEAPRPLLLQNVLHDFLVANHASLALARAVDAEFVGPYFMDTPDLRQRSIPVGGLEGDGLAVMSFYRDILLDGVPRTADHGNHLASDTGISQSGPFLKSGVVVEAVVP